MASDNGYKNYPVAKYEGCTEVRVQKVTYLWTIKNFSFCNSGFSSPSFTADTYKNLDWHMNVKLSIDFVALYLKLSPTTSTRKPTASIKAKFRMSILNTKGEKANMKEVPKLVEYRLDKYGGFDRFIERSYLLNEENGLISEDKVKIFCEIDMVVGIKKNSDSSSIAVFNDCECKLSKNFDNLLNDAQFSDVTLVVGDQELSAHKAILANSSEIFAAMFKHEMKENLLDRVTITDIKYEVAKEMLRFMYTGKLSNLGEMAGDLLVAADKYALDEMKVLCEKLLCNQLSFDTASELLVLANRHSANLLKRKTIDFICTYGNEVTKTQGWKNVIAEHSQSIANELLLIVEQIFPTNPGNLK